MRLRGKIRKTTIRYISEAIISLFAVMPRRRYQISSRRILVIRLATLGETVLTFPMMRAIRTAYSGAHISVLTQVKPLWESNPDVDEVIPYSFSRLLRMIFVDYRSYDIVIDTEPTNNITGIAAYCLGKTAIGFSTANRAPLFDHPIPLDDQKYMAEVFLDLLKPLGCPNTFECLIMHEPIKQDSVEKIKECLDRDKIRIGINLGASNAAPERLWPGRNYAELMKQLHQTFPCQFVFFGVKREHELLKELTPQLDGIDYLDLTDRLNLHELIDVIKEMLIFICCDTGTMHLAAAMGIPTFSFFGPDLPVRFAPRTPESKYFYHSVPCSPCINEHLPNYISREKICSGECIKNITVVEVFTAVKEYLANRKQ